jgi:hypothetical protein
MRATLEHALSKCLEDGCAEQQTYAALLDQTDRLREIIRRSAF